MECTVLLPDNEEKYNAVFRKACTEGQGSIFWLFYTGIVLKYSFTLQKKVCIKFIKGVIQISCFYLSLPPKVLMEFGEKVYLA